MTLTERAIHERARKYRVERREEINARRRARNREKRVASTAQVPTPLLLHIVQLLQDPLSFMLRQLLQMAQNCLSLYPS
jgi:hypothetical protein